MTKLTIVQIERIELRFSRESWSFSRRYRAEIDAHFADRKRQTPALWNGQVLLLRDPDISDEIFRGICFAVDYASFLAWRDWGFPGEETKENVAQGALRSADGAYLLGVMADHTSHPGSIHFPSGLPDLNDVTDASVNLHASMLREISEETGLIADDFVSSLYWRTIYGGPRVAHFKVLQLNEDATTLRTRILNHLARDPQPELADIRIVRSANDLRPEIDPTTTAFLNHIWSK